MRRGHRPAGALRVGLVAGLALGLASGGPAVAAQDVGPGVAPVAIDVPVLGAHAAVVPLGEDDDGGMQAPTDPDTVGWYAPGAGIGVPGNALLDGHVDWGGRPRAFGLLRRLAPGDEVRLADASGDVLVYAVDWTRLYAADAAPLDEIFEQGPREEITLITCGGQFDTASHQYLARWVVRAHRVGPPDAADQD